MKYRVAGRLAAASIAALSLAAIGAPAQAGEKIANSYICVFKKDAVGKADVAGKSNAAVRAQGGNVKFVYRNSIRGFAANMSATAVTAMRRSNPTIAYCEQDQVVTLGPITVNARPGGGSSPAESTPWGITRVNGGVSGATGTAWIIDSGIDPTHLDLNIDSGRSRDFTGSRSGWKDENGHGSHVAGTVAAVDNTIGVIGVAAGARVAAVRVLDRRGSGSYSGVIAGVDYVAGAGVAGDVANMSLGGPVSTALDDAVIAAATNVKFALAAGNESDDANNHSPARAGGFSKTDKVFAVSAFAEVGDKFASFSNFGNAVEWAEPGVSVYSTYKDGGYATLSGTSMAAPHLAGIMLLGAVTKEGTVTSDPDGNPDPIGVR